MKHDSVTMKDYADYIDTLLVFVRLRVSSRIPFADIGLLCTRLPFSPPSSLPLSFRHTSSSSRMATTLPTNSSHTRYSRRAHTRTCPPRSTQPYLPSSPPHHSLPPPPPAGSMADSPSVSSLVWLQRSGFANTSSGTLLWLTLARTFSCARSASKAGRHGASIRLSGRSPFCRSSPRCSSSSASSSSSGN